MIIKITYDYVDENSKSYLEGNELIRLGKSFTTNCLEFFDFDIFNKRVDDVIVLKKDGTSISLRKLLGDISDYTDKEIRETYDARVLLTSGVLKFKENVFDRVDFVFDRVDLGRTLCDRYLYITHKDIDKVDSIVEQIKLLDIEQHCDSITSIDYIKKHLIEEDDVYYIKFDHILNNYKITYNISQSRMVYEDSINDQGYDDGFNEVDFVSLCSEMTIDEFLNLKFKNTYIATPIKESLGFGTYTYNKHYVQIKPLATTKESEYIKVPKDKADAILKILNE